MSAFDRVNVIALDEDHRLGSRWEWASRPLAIGRGTLERCSAVYDPCWKVRGLIHAKNQSHRVPDRARCVVYVGPVSRFHGQVESVFFLLGLAVALDGLLRLLGRGG